MSPLHKLVPSVNFIKKLLGFVKVITFIQLLHLLPHPPSSTFIKKNQQNKKLKKKKSNLEIEIGRKQIDS